MVRSIIFNKRLSTVLEDNTARRAHPAIIITARGVEIRADHARWMKTTKGNVFLAVGIHPRIKERTVSYYNRGGVLRRARDFYAPEETESHLQSPTILRVAKHQYKRIVRQRFSKILTIRKENVKSIRWL